MREISGNRLKTWEANCGALCFLGGLLAALMGCLLTAALWIIGADLHPWISDADTTLFAVAIPLILFAGFWLDWSEQPSSTP